MTWIQTNSGSAYRLDTGEATPGLDYRADVVVPLSRIPRFLGHTRSPWSVAAHAVIGSVLAERALRDPGLALAFLHHEDGEALVGDVPSPLKALLPGFRDLERTAHFAASRAGGYDHGVVLATPGVKRLDAVMLAAEHAVLQSPEPVPWSDPPDPHDDWLVQRAAALVANAAAQGRGWGVRAADDFLERLEDLEHLGHAKEAR